ncbi:hypothetical protein C3L33_19757, partial [Rhododendron williamsianum]
MYTCPYGGFDCGFMLNTQVGVDLILPMLSVCDDHGGARRHCFLGPTLPRSVVYKLKILLQLVFDFDGDHYGGEGGSLSGVGEWKAFRDNKRGKGKLGVSSVKLKPLIFFSKINQNPYLPPTIAASISPVAEPSPPSKSPSPLAHGTTVEIVLLLIEAY